jgi:hypothetical protein
VHLIHCVYNIHDDDDDDDDDGELHDATATGSQ